MNIGDHGSDERQGDGRSPVKAESIGPAYDQDDGPLSEGDLAVLRQIGAYRLPKGELVAVRRLV